MGKARRYNDYDSDVDFNRKQKELYGRQRQQKSVGSSFRSLALTAGTGGTSSSSSSGGDFDPVIVNENNLGNVSTATNISWSTANFHRLVLTGSITISHTDLPAAGKYEEVVLQIEQDATGGHTVTWADAPFYNGLTPSVAAGANAVTTLVFYSYDDGASRILAFNTIQLTSLSFALGDENSKINKTSSTTPVVTFRMPYAMTLTDVRSSLTQAGTSGLTTVDIKEGGTSIFSTLLTIDANERTSTSAATPVVISDGSIADDAEMTVFITAKGGGSPTGLKVTLIGYIT